MPPIVETQTNAAPNPLLGLLGRVVDTVGSVAQARLAPPTGATARSPTDAPRGTLPAEGLPPARDVITPPASAPAVPQTVLIAAGAALVVVLGFLALRR